MFKGEMELLIRARSIGRDVFFAVKGTAKGKDVVHGIDRLEFEIKINKSLEEINEILIKNKIVLITKRYSERSLYKISEGMELNIEFVSGYGYKA